MTTTAFSVSLAKREEPAASDLLGGQVTKTDTAQV